MGTHCSAASWSFHIVLLRKITCPVVHLSPAPLAPQTCWQSLWMATGSYTGFFETEGDIFFFQFRLILIFFFCIQYSAWINVLFRLFLSSDSSFFEGAFIAEDTSVSAFVDVLHKAVKQAGFKLFVN